MDGSDIARPEFELPDRGRYGANATIFQKRKLEEAAAHSGALPERFYEVIDSLGRQQADDIFGFLQRRSEYDQRLTLQAEEADRRANSLHRSIKLLIALIWASVMYIAYRAINKPDTVAAALSMATPTAIIATAVTSDGATIFTRVVHVRPCSSPRRL